MSDKKSGKQGGGSSEPNGPNNRADSASSSVGLSQSQQRELHEQMKGENMTYQEIRQLAEDIKNGKKQLPIPCRNAGVFV